MDHHNTDYVDFEFLGSSHDIPARIPAAAVYGFRPLLPGDLANQMRHAQLEAQAERIARGLASGSPSACTSSRSSACPSTSCRSVGGGGRWARRARSSAPGIYVWVAIEASGEGEKGRSLALNQLRYLQVMCGLESVQWFLTVMVA
ncbi:unnamed protein product [Durusdinium trenchii]|uniref:Uncharacterized protein n=2 Tax=Durusdinium trenchii TaxID=1381693 RepID=A0ABP0IWQ6_9DINO